MSAKQRLKKIEQARTAGKGTGVIVITADTIDKDIVNFDGVLMPRKEAEKKAAALPDSVLLLRVIYEDKDIEKNKVNDLSDVGFYK
jgi:hypothetical protein